MYSFNLLSYSMTLQGMQIRAVRNSAGRGDIGGWVWWEGIGPEIRWAKETGRGYWRAVCRSRRDGGEMRGVIGRGEGRTLYLMGIHNGGGLVEVVAVWWRPSF